MNPKLRQCLWNLSYQLQAPSRKPYSAAFSTQKPEPSWFLTYTSFCRESPWKNADDTSKVPIRHLLSSTSERIAFTVSLRQLGDSNCTDSLENSLELFPIVSLALTLLSVLDKLSVFSVMTQVVRIISAPHGAWGTDFMTLNLKNFSSSVFSYNNVRSVVVFPCQFSIVFILCLNVRQSCLQLAFV